MLEFHARCVSARACAAPPRNRLPLGTSFPSWSRPSFNNNANRFICQDAILALKDRLRFDSPVLPSLRAASQNPYAYHAGLAAEALKAVETAPVNTLKSSVNGRPWPEIFTLIRGHIRPDAFDRPQARTSRMTWPWTSVRRRLAPLW